MKNGLMGMHSIGAIQIFAEFWVEELGGDHISLIFKGCIKSPSNTLSNTDHEPSIAQGVRYFFSHGTCSSGQMAFHIIIASLSHIRGIHTDEYMHYIIEWNLSEWETHTFQRGGKMDSDNFHPPVQRLCLYFLSFYEKMVKNRRTAMMLLGIWLSSVT